MQYACIYCVSSDCSHIISNWFFVLSLSPSVCIRNTHVSIVFPQIVVRSLPVPPVRTCHPCFMIQNISDHVLVITVIMNWKSTSSNKRCFLKKKKVYPSNMMLWNSQASINLEDQVHPRSRNVTFTLYIFTQPVKK